VNDVVAPFGVDTVVAGQVTDVDSDDPPDMMAANYVFSFTSLEVLVCGDPATPIHTIQGNGAASSLVGTANVVIEGVVIGDYQNTTTQFSGFYVQEEDAAVDADPLTCLHNVPNHSNWRQVR
jgi:predicted extracellular nuclease